MPKSLKRYTDPMKAREYRNRQRKINYDRCPGDPAVSHSRYTEDEERLIAGWGGRTASCPPRQGGACAQYR